MLELEKVRVYYGRTMALRDISLKVNRGEIVTLIGANGAGKTTLLNAISGLVRIQSGNINLMNRDIKGIPVNRIAGLGVGYVPEGRQIFSTMSVLDNLVLGSYNRCSGKWQYLLGPISRFLTQDSIEESFSKVFALFPVLEGRKKQKAGSLSGGEQQMLAIGRALMSSPEVMLLDEPSIGLAPALVREIFSLFKKLRDSGLTILLVEQDASAALKIADRGYVLEMGRIVIEGSADDLVRNERVRQAYLGKTRGEAAP